METINADPLVGQHGKAQESMMDESQMDSIYRKVMWRIVPFLFAAFVMAWIDRVNVGFTKLQMNESLVFSEAVYGLGAGLFFIGYFLFEVPSNMALQRYGVRVTISRIAVGWGLATCALMFVETPLQFYFLRFVIGACEAGLWPGIVLYVTYWLPSARRGRAYAFINSATCMAGIIGAPLAGIIMEQMNGVRGYAGWQWVFLIEGIPSVLIGIAAIWILSDKPERAHWLSANERSALLKNLDKEASAGGAREHSLRNALLSKPVWMFSLMYFIIILGSATLIFWAPTMLRDVGIKSTQHIGYIISCVYAIGMVAMIFNGIHSDCKKEARLHCGLAVLVCSMGCALLGYLLTQGTIWIVLALCIAHPAILAAIPIFWQFPNKKLSGTAAAVGIALINSTGNLAGFFSPVAMGVVKDATGQVAPVIFVVSALVAVGAILILRQKDQSLI